MLGRPSGSVREQRGRRGCPLSLGVGGEVPGCVTFFLLGVRAGTHSMSPILLLLCSVLGAQPFGFPHPLLRTLSQLPQA